MHSNAAAHNLFVVSDQNPGRDDEYSCVFSGVGADTAACAVRMKTWLHAASGTCALHSTEHGSVTFLLGGILMPVKGCSETEKVVDISRTVKESDCSWC